MSDISNNTKTSCAIPLAPENVRLTQMTSAGG